MQRNSRLDRNLAKAVFASSTSQPASITTCRARGVSGDCVFFRTPTALAATAHAETLNADAVPAAGDDHGSMLKTATVRLHASCPHEIAGLENLQGGAKMT
jgi:hypothetical protein